MFCLNLLWKKSTQRAMDQSTGPLETSFFESTYRITYASGISLSEHQSTAYRIYSNIIKLSIVMFLVSEILNLVGLKYGLDAVIDNINVTIIHLLIIYRYKNMMDNKHIYNEQAKCMNSPLFNVSTSERKKIIKFWQKKNSQYFKRLLTLATFVLAIWYVYPLLDDLEYNLVATLWLPIEYKTPYRYVIVYIVVLFAFHAISYFVVANDLMMQTYLIHLICQFAVLSNCFRNMLVDCKKDFQGFTDTSLINDNRFRETFNKHLGNLVEQHKFVLKNSTELRQILSRPMLVQLAASCILICLAGYQVTATVTANLAKFFVSLLYLIYNLYTFYLICRWCDEIKIQSESIAQSVFWSGWEKGMATVPGVRIRLLLIVARATRPMVLTAGGIYDVSLNSYTTLVKTSYSVLTVLLRMRQR